MTAKKIAIIKKIKIPKYSSLKSEKLKEKCIILILNRFTKNIEGFEPTMLNLDQPVCLTFLNFNGNYNKNLVEELLERFMYGFF